MASINLIESFQDFKDAENIDRPHINESAGRRI